RCSLVPVATSSTNLFHRHRSRRYSRTVRSSGTARSTACAAAVALSSALAFSAALASEYDAHLVGASPGAYEAVNPVQGLKATFTNVVTVVPASAAPRWEMWLSFAAAGYRSEPQRVAAAVPRASTNRVDE